jgi:DNA polymerase-3 subunit epsilon
VGFLDVELGLAGHPPCETVYGKLVDTLALAREMFPGKRNGLDALCERFAVDNSHRTLHGALLDAELLAEVWLAMTRGQDTLTIDLGAPLPGNAGAAAPSAPGCASLHRRGPLPVVLPDDTEAAAHREYLAALDKETGGRCLWLALEANVPPQAAAA